MVELDSRSSVTHLSLLVVAIFVCLLVLLLLPVTHYFKLDSGNRCHCNRS